MEIKGLGNQAPKKAKESSQIKRMRKDVKRHIQEENKLMTKKALKDATDHIKHWTERHLSEKVEIGERTVAPTTSDYVINLQKVIEKGLKPPKSLTGRVTPKKD